MQIAAYVHACTKASLMDASNIMLFPRHIHKYSHPQHSESVRAKNLKNENICPYIELEILSPPILGRAQLEWK